MKRYSEEHLWVESRDGTATVGLTPYAADELGEITFVELPEVGTVFSQGDVLCVVETAKAATELIAPIGGTVLAVNQRLDDEPELLSSAPESAGWICRLTDLDPGEFEALLTEDEYELFLAGTEGDAAPNPRP